MSIVDYENLNPSQLIGQYILEQRGKGHFLGYDDHHLISEWLKLAPDADSLLLVLSDLVPNYYKDKEKAIPRSLKGLNKKVQKKLRELAMR